MNWFAKIAAFRVTTLTNLVTLKAFAFRVRLSEIKRNFETQLPSAVAKRMRQQQERLLMLRREHPRRLRLTRSGKQRGRKQLPLLRLNAPPNGRSKHLTRELTSRKESWQSATCLDSICFHSSYVWSPTTTFRDGCTKIYVNAWSSLSRISLTRSLHGSCCRCHLAMGNLSSRLSTSLLGTSDETPSTK